MRPIRLSWILSIATAASAFSTQGCSTTALRPPEELLAQAEAGLQGWKSRWAPSGIPAENEDATSAERSLDVLLDLNKKKDALAIDRERLSFLLAEAQFACDELKAAYANYQSLLENYPFTENKSRAERAIFQIAVLWSQRGGSFLGTGLDSDRDRAIAALQYLTDRAARSPEADDALKLMGSIYYRDHEFEEAIATFERIVKEYDKSEWRDTAEFFIAMSYLRRVRSPRVDRGGLLQAEMLLREHTLRWPESAFRAQAEAAYAETREKLAESTYGIGEFYKRIGQDYGARYYWEATRTQYPKSRFASLASRALAEVEPSAASTEEK